MAETSKTVSLALRVLQRLPDVPVATATGLAGDLGASRQAVLRCLHSLEQFAMVHQGDTGWVLGRGVLELAHRATGDLVNALRPALVELASAWNETALIALPVGDQAVAADQVIALGRMVRIDYAVGSAYELVVGAHGRAILAFHPTRNSLAKGSPIRTDIQLIRERGYAVSHDEIEHGVTGVAAPILDPDGFAVASIGIVAPTQRVTNLGELANAIVTTASHASRTLATSNPSTYRIASQQHTLVRR
jgi:DNA-binding IclR family transcriptional regulator